MKKGDIDNIVQLIIKRMNEDFRTICDTRINGSSDKVRGIPTQIYQRYMIDFP